MLAATKKAQAAVTKTAAKGNTGNVVSAAKVQGAAAKTLPGDGLVPVRSALGQHEDAAQALPIPVSRQCVVYGTDHFDLLGSAVVYKKLHGWLLKP